MEINLGQKATLGRVASDAALRTAVCSRNEGLIKLLFPGEYLRSKMVDFG